MPLPRRTTDTPRILLAANDTIFYWRVYNNENVESFKLDFVSLFKFLPIYTFYKQKFRLSNTSICDKSNLNTQVSAKETNLFVEGYSFIDVLTFI